MSETAKTIISKHEPRQGTLLTYVVGFVTSIILTLIAFSLVEIHVHAANHAASNNPLIAAIIGLALIQFLIQAFFFLHLGKETKPRWKLLVFYFMILVVGILVFGSLWIMSNLNYRMTPEQMNHYLQGQDGL